MSRAKKLIFSKTASEGLEKLTVRLGLQIKPNPNYDMNRNGKWFSYIAGEKKNETFLFNQEKFGKITQTNKKNYLKN